MKNENQTNATPNAEDFLGGNYLKKEDIREPQNVTVVDVWSETVLGSNRPKLIIAFEEIEKPLILNKTNTKRLIQIFGTPDTTEWRGRILLYVEKTVEFGGRMVGGVRVKRPRVVNGLAEKMHAMAAAGEEADIL